MKVIPIKDFQVGNNQNLTLMGGMNVIESEETALLARSFSTPNHSIVLSRLKLP